MHNKINKKLKIKMEQKILNLAEKIVNIIEGKETYMTKSCIFFERFDLSIYTNENNNNKYFILKDSKQKLSIIIEKEKTYYICEGLSWTKDDNPIQLLNIFDEVFQIKDINNSWTCEEIYKAFELAQKVFEETKKKEDIERREKFLKRLFDLNIEI